MSKQKTFEFYVSEHLMPFIYNGVDCPEDLDGLSELEIDFIYNSPAVESISIVEDCVDPEWHICAVTGLHNNCYLVSSLTDVWE